MKSVQELIETEIDSLVMKQKEKDKLKAFLVDIGFYTAPCSGSNHLCREGGLAEHSFNVYRYMRGLHFVWDMHSTGVYQDSVFKVSILHDVGKCGDFGKPNYIPKYVNSKKKDENGEYIKELSKASPYETNKDLLYLPHEVRSIILCRKHGIPLTEEEEHAIFFHNGKYVPSGRDWNETPLSMALHFADLYVSRAIESKETSNFHLLPIESRKWDEE